MTNKLPEMIQPSNDWMSKFQAKQDAKAKEKECDNRKKRRGGNWGGWANKKPALAVALENADVKIEEVPSEPV